MNIRKNDIKTLIVMVIIFAICSLTAIFLNKKSNYESLISMTDYGEFFSISNCVNKYISYVSKKNMEGTYLLLDKNYISKNLITKENLFSEIDNYNKDLSIYITNIEYTNIKKNIIYYVKGQFIKNDFDSIKKSDESFELMVLLDSKNLSYSIYPVSGDIKESINDIKKININPNDYNSLNKNSEITKERMCTFYLNNYYLLLNYDLEKAYEITSSGMKKKYLNYNLFKEYIQKNINNFSSTADRCKVDEYNNGRIYSVIDKNGNKYVFNEKSILNYEIDIYSNDELNILISDKRDIEETKEIE